jgi:hypothetical protein
LDSDPALIVKHVFFSAAADWFAGGGETQPGMRKIAIKNDEKIGFGEISLPQVFL